jgi:CspA family cold shock protein
LGGLNAQSSGVKSSFWFADVPPVFMTVAGNLLFDLSENLIVTPIVGVRPHVRKGTIMQTGTVKWFNAQKGFGFIQPSEGGADVFVHISAVERAGLGTLNEGQTIGFVLEQDRRSGKMSAGQLQAV